MIPKTAVESKVVLEDFARRTTAVAIAFVPPSFPITPTIPPMTKQNTMIPMFQLSAREFETRYVENELSNPSRGFQPAIIVAPAKMPRNRETITCRVQIASTIARTGGTRANHPYASITYSFIYLIML